MEPCGNLGKELAGYWMGMAVVAQYPNNEDDEQLVDGWRSVLKSQSTQ